MCCPKALCASAATVCCPTASAKNCCPWRAHCLPNRDTNLCFLRPCQIAHRGNAHVAEKPCAWSNASPRHNSSSQPSIPHDYHRQPALPACSSHVCAPVCAPHRELPQYYSEEHPYR